MTVKLDLNRTTTICDKDGFTITTQDFPWFWENNYQKKVEGLLKNLNYKITEKTSSSIIFEKGNIKKDKGRGEFGEFFLSSNYLKIFTTDTGYEFYGPKISKKFHGYLNLSKNPKLLEIIIKSVSKLI